MAKSAATKHIAHSLNQGAPSRTGMKGGAKGPAVIKNATAGGKGDKDGKGDIQAKKAGTSNFKRTGSK